MNVKVSDETLQQVSRVPEHESPYERDYCLWIDYTIQLIQQGEFSKMDIPNLLDELDDMSGSQRDALESNLEIVLMHLLKYCNQPKLRSRSWLLTIFEHRNRLKKVFRRSPSLQRHYQEVFQESYQTAKKMASIETGLSLSDFPEVSPFTHEQVLDTDYLP